MTFVEWLLGKMLKKRVKTLEEIYALDPEGSRNYVRENLAEIEETLEELERWQETE